MRQKISGTVLRPCIIYAVVSGVWIVVSDRVLFALIHDPETERQIETYKGWVFIAFTSVLLYFVLRTQLRRWGQQVEKREAAETAVQEKNRALRMLRDCGQALMRATEETELLQEVCRIAKESGGYPMAWVGYAEEDEAKTVRIAGHAGADPERLGKMKLTWADTSTGRGPTGTAIRTGEPSVVQDAASAPSLDPWRELKPCLENRSICALPLKARGRAFGALTIFSPQPNGFDANEIALLRELADDLAFGVTALRTRAAHARAQADLALFRRQLDYSNDAVFVTDPATGQILDANDTACRRLGYTADEMRQLTVLQIVGERNDLQVWAERFQRLKAAGTSIFETRHHRKDGTSFPVEVSTSLVEQDGRSYLIGVARDVTDRKDFEEERRRSEDMLATAQRIAHFGSWELDLTNPDVNANRLRWSDEAYRVFGYEPRSVEVTNELFFQAILPQERGLIEEAVGRALRDRTEYSLDHSILLPSGEIRFVHEHAKVFTNERTGQLLKMVGTVHDITERKRAELKLQRFMSMSPAVIYALKVTGNGLQLMWTSENLGHLTGYSVVEAGDRNWWVERIHPDDCARVQAAHRMPYETEHLVLEFRFRRMDGSYIWVHDEKRFLRDADGKPVEVVGVWTDATERVQLEQQLLQSQKMEAIGTLAGGVAHDFNNLLTVIQGHSSLLLARPPTEGELAESLTQIAEAADRGASLTRQLLIFSRKQFMDPVALDLNEVISNLTRMLVRIVGEDITLASELAPSLPLMHGDRGMIEQIMLNLTVNARDAMPRGGRLTIATSAELVDAGSAPENSDAIPRPRVCLSVRDTGCGISPQALPHIFEPFFTTKAVGKGTGLGLATTYGIVKLHRGSITVESEVNRGSTFKIHFPATVGVGPERKSATDPAPLEHGTETIFVVEDEVPVRALVANLLTQLQYRVLEAPTGVAALEVWSRHRDEISLLLTDMVMPDGMTGRELAERLLAEKPTLRVIYTSGYSADIAGGDLPLTEGVNFLQKPYTSQRLSKALRDNLDRR